MKAELKEYIGPKGLTLEDLVDAGAFVDAQDEINLVAKNGRRICFRSNGQVLDCGIMTESEIKDEVRYVLPEGTRITLET